MQARQVYLLAPWPRRAEFGCLVQCARGAMSLRVPSWSYDRESPAAWFEATIVLRILTRFSARLVARFQGLPTAGFARRPRQYFTKTPATTGAKAALGRPFRFSIDVAIRDISGVSGKRPQTRARALLNPLSAPCRQKPPRP